MHTLRRSCTRHGSERILLREKSYISSDIDSSFGYTGTVLPQPLRVPCPNTNRTILYVEPVECAEGVGSSELETMNDSR